MNADSIPIRAGDKLQTLFERDDRLIDVIASHSPQLAKLRHSPMRRVMARITTVAQAARLCNLPTETLLRDLNAVLGVKSDEIGEPDAAPAVTDSTATPSFENAVELDVRDDLAKGGEPFSKIMSAIAALPEAGVLHLRAPFEPVPLLTVLAKRGFGHKSERHADDDWSVWFFRQADAAEQIESRQSHSNATHTVPVGDTSLRSDAARTEEWLDVRDMEPPEPLVTTLSALEKLPPGHVLVQRNLRIPQFLLPILRERGFHFTIDELQSDEVQVRIWRNE